MALEKTAAALVNLSQAADNLINHCQDHSAEIASLNAQLAQVQSDVAAADDSTAAAIQAEADKIIAAGTPPA